MITEEMRAKKEEYEERSGKEGYYPEHSTSPNDLVYSVHSPRIHGKDEPCTVHNMTEHPLRWWPQLWLSRVNSSPEEVGMWRVCQHGVRHPDPDDPIVTLKHECDDCCTQEYPESFPTHLLNAENKKLVKFLGKNPMEGSLSILTPKRRSKYPSIIIHSKEQGALMRITLVTTGKAGSYAPLLAHAEDVALPQGNNKLKQLRLSALSHGELEATPLADFVGSTLFPLENNDPSAPLEGEGYLLCLSLVFEDDKGEEFTSRVSFLMDALDGFSVKASMIKGEEDMDRLKALEEFYLE